MFACSYAPPEYGQARLGPNTVADRSLDLKYHSILTNLPPPSPDLAAFNGQHSRPGSRSLENSREHAHLEIQIEYESNIF